MSRLEVVTRGRDSSGRPLRATRQMFQHFDRVNERVGGRLVIVQGSFMPGTGASAGTHDRAGCLDIRTWNLTATERNAAIRAGRDPRQVGGAVWWYRTRAQGFDPHIHMLLLGDSPLSGQALWQDREYRAGRNGLASQGRDDFWRPAVITNYKYVEDDMFSERDRRMLEAIHEGLWTYRKNERARDQAEVERDRKRFSQVVTLLGQQADRLTVLINQTEDDATKRQLYRMKTQILAALKEDPAVTGPDNPSDEGMAESQ